MGHNPKNRNLATVRPDLVKEWDVRKNGVLKPDEVAAGSHIRVWWKCDQGEDHEWLAEIKSRVNGNGCPYCAGQKACRTNNLAIRFPDLVPGWHPERNGSLTPYDVTPGSGIAVWWKCDEGHEWLATPHNRVKGNGCPFCSGRYASYDKNLAITNPNLAIEWHAEKNGDLTPCDVLPHSNKKCWWKCPVGHEWLATVNSRMAGCGCPYCSGRNATPQNNLAIKNPELAAEWEIAKNGNLTPHDVSPTSNKKVWWKCDKGHKWFATVGNRAAGNGCPFCSGKLLSDDNNLAVRFPELIAEWDIEKNGDLTPDKVMPGSDKRVWWKCSKGHASYLATPNSRTTAKSGCPMCKMQTSRPEFRLFCELKFVFGDAEWQRRMGRSKCDIYVPSHKIAIEYDGFYWHRNTLEKDRKKGERLKKRNIILFRLREHGLSAVSPLDVVMGSQKAFLDSIKQLMIRLSSYVSMSSDEQARCQIYLDSDDFVNSVAYNKMVYSLSIPRLKDSVAAHPVLNREWDDDRNGAGKQPYMFSLGSGERIWWKCNKGHSWLAPINRRTGSNTGCPECSGQRPGKDNNLANSSPELAIEWNIEKNGNLKPHDVTSCSGRKVWWKCAEGHEWLAVISSRVKGNGCPFCSRKLATESNNLAVQFPELVAEWNFDKNGALRPDKILPGSSRKVWWKCRKDHEWSTTVSSRASGTGCPECAGQRVGKDNNLAVRFPGLVSEWHKTKNVALTPDRVMPGSDRKVWWRCRNGHEWQAVISSRVAGSGCPSCNRNRQKARRHATEDNNLAIKNPVISLEWHPDKNGDLTIYDVTLGSHSKVWWRCNEGHEWQARIQSRVKRNANCPICRKK